MRARKKKGDDPAAVERAIDQVRLIVKQDGSIARSRLARLGIKKALQREAIERLESDGIESTPKVLRVPLRDQLAAKIREGSAIAMRAIAHAATGGTKREVTLAALDLVKGREAMLVVRGTEVILCSPRTDVLGEQELGALERTVTGLLKSLKTAHKQKAELLTPDVRDLLQPFASAAGTRIDVPGVLAEAARHKLASGLVFVPAIVRALGGRTARDAVHEALRTAAKRGLVELRPESGLGRLSEEDLAFCIPGPQGSRLSWARPIEEAR